MNAVAKTFMLDHDPAIAQAVEAELKTVDWRNADGWSELTTLADVVTLTSLVIYTETMSVDGSHVTVPADLTVHLTYNGAVGQVADEFDQNFPAILRFIFLDGTAKLSAIEADISADLS